MEVRDLTVRHALASQDGSKTHIEAVKQLSLEVFAGELLAITGESGCGKSSLARAMAGLLAAHSGKILFRGEDIAQRKKSASSKNRAFETQFLFQDPHSALSPRRRIYQTLAEPLPLRGVTSKAEIQQQIDSVLSEVNLGHELLTRFPHQLSGGQKQRIALARALLCQPALIIADEPMSALDVSEQARLMELISRLRREKQIAFLLISHDLAVVQQLADRVGVMYLGSLVEIGPAGVLLSQPAHPYTQALVNATRRNWQKSEGEPPVLPGEPPSALTPPTGCVFHSRCAQRMAHCDQQVPRQYTLEDQPGYAYSHRVQCHLHSELNQGRPE